MSHINDGRHRAMVVQRAKERAQRATVAGAFHEAIREQLKEEAAAYAGTSREVHLADFDHVSVIILDETTGITWSTVAGGAGREHVACEGILVPLADRLQNYTAHERLYAATHQTVPGRMALDDYDFDLVDHLLAEWQVGARSDREATSYEAWVYLDLDMDQWPGDSGVLTWKNCD